MKTLPNKMSELLLLAVEDSESIEKRSDYKLNMDGWYYKSDSICEVCMAGAVMVCSLELNEPSKVKISFPSMPVNMENLVRSKLLAINNMRVGWFGAPLIQLEGYDVLSDNQKLALNKARNLILAEKDLNSGNFLNGQGRAEWDTYRQAVKVLAEAGL